MQRKQINKHNGYHDRRFQPLSQPSVGRETAALQQFAAAAFMTDWKPRLALFAY